MHVCIRMYVCIYVCRTWRSEGKSPRKTVALNSFTVSRTSVSLRRRKAAADKGVFGGALAGAFVSVFVRMYQ